MMSDPQRFIMSLENVAIANALQRQPDAAQSLSALIGRPY